MPYYARFEPDRESGGFVVTFPGMSKGATQGETFPEAMGMAREMLHMILADHIAAGEPLPSEARRKGGNYHVVTLPALVEAKLALYLAYRKSGMRKSDLTRKAGIPSGIDRLFDLDHRSPIDQLEAAFRALGKAMRIRVEDAA